VHNAWRRRRQQSGHTNLSDSEAATRWRDATPAMERRLYGHLLTQESPDHQKLKKAQNSAMKDFYLGPSSLVLPTNAAAAVPNT
jgi:hypothetical protein